MSRIMYRMSGIVYVRENIAYANMHEKTAAKNCCGKKERSFYTQAATSLITEAGT